MLNRPAEPTKRPTDAELIAFLRRVGNLDSQSDLLLHQTSLRAEELADSLAIASKPVPPCSVCGGESLDPESEHACPECGQPLDPDFYAMHVAPQLQIQRGADR